MFGFFEGFGQTVFSMKHFLCERGKILVVGERKTLWKRCSVDHPVEDLLESVDVCKTVAHMAGPP